MQNDKARFKIKVYQVVSKIPRGRVLTYKKVAELAGHPRAWRAVGNILNKNKNPKIPCYRVVRSNGLVGGYRSGSNKKMSLLKSEGVAINLVHKRVLKKAQ